jgi:flagellar secretion chaperone FliS
MALNKAYNQYKENSIFTSSSEELTLMLFNGLVRFIMQGQQAISLKDIEKANKSIIRAQDIISYFQSTLDNRFDVSEGLSLIYDYMYRRLIDANIKKDNAILDEMLGFAKELRDTWSQAMKMAKQQKPHLAVQE